MKNDMVEAGVSQLSTVKKVEFGFGQIEPEST